MMMPTGYKSDDGWPTCGCLLVVLLIHFTLCDDR